MVKGLDGLLQVGVALLTFLYGVLAGIGRYVYGQEKEQRREIEEEITEMKEYLEEVDRRSTQNRYTLFGDPDDPNQTGLAEDVNSIKEDVRWIKDHLNGEEDD